MDVSFKDQSLDRLETDATYSAGFGDGLAEGISKGDATHPCGNR